MKLYVFFSLLHIGLVAGAKCQTVQFTDRGAVAAASCSVVNTAAPNKKGLSCGGNAGGTVTVGNGQTGKIEITMTKETVDRAFGLVFLDGQGKQITQSYLVKAGTTCDDSVPSTVNTIIRAYSTTNRVLLKGLGFP